MLHNQRLANTNQPQQPRAQMEDFNNVGFVTHMVVFVTSQLDSSQEDTLTSTEMILKWQKYVNYIYQTQNVKMLKNDLIR